MDDDIEAVIKIAKHMRDEKGSKPFLNSASSLPASKRKTKLAIKERIRQLCVAYISLASFVSDENIEVFWDDGKAKGQKAILKRVLREMERNRKEIEGFDPLDLED